ATTAYARPLHPLPGPAHRRQAEVRPPPPPNSQRKGSRCDRCPCEDHAQLWRAQKQPTQAVCSRRRLILLYGAPVWSTAALKRAFMQQAESAHRRACLRVIGGRPHVAYEATYVLAGIPPLALLADERARLYGRRREDAKDEERLATLSKWQEAWDRSKKARWTHRLIPNIRVWIERRHGELNYHLTQLLTGHGFLNTIADATTTIKALNARSAPHPSRMRSTCSITARGQRRKRETTLPALRGHDAGKHHQAHARELCPEAKPRGKIFARWNDQILSRVNQLCILKLLNQNANLLTALSYSYLLLSLTIMKQRFCGNSVLLHENLRKASNHLSPSVRDATEMTRGCQKNDKHRVSTYDQIRP
ncbi:unnamed protein product, partial [Trichogramma brassicae]